MMNKTCTLFAISQIFVLFQLSTSYRILQIVPGLGDSHLLFHYKIARMLHNAGHNVTLLTLIMSLGTLSDPHPPDNIQELRVGVKGNEKGKSHIISSFQKSVFKPLSLKNVVQIIQTLNRGVVEACQDVSNDEELFEELLAQNFDAVLSHYVSLCPIGIAHKLNITKSIWIVAGTFIMVKPAQILSLPNSASYIPDISADVSDRMIFLDRLKNFLFQAVDTVMTNMPGSSMSDLESKAFQKFPNEGFPHLWNLAQHTQALLINGEDLLDFPRPLFLNVMHMGDLGHKQPKHLNEEWQRFMDNSEDGVILFSLGTIANTSLMPIEMKQAFLKAFLQFPNYSIIWRLEGQMPKRIEKLKNLKIVTWIPQKEILHHPKLRLFITHGGYNSLMETAQAAVPMILIPLFGDQYGNARRAERYGLGLTLDKLHADAEHITRTVRKVLTEEKFRLNVNRFSKMLQDKIIPSENFTLHIINKILRSPNWQLPLAPKKLNFFQYFCLDVISLFLFVLISLCYILWKILFCVYTFLKRVRQNVND